MSDYYRKLADKFFNNQSSAREAEKVLKWLDSPEGREYLSEKIDEDLTSFNEDTETDEYEDELPSYLKKLNPERHFSGIMSVIGQIDKTGHRHKKRDFLTHFLKVAAGILVVAAASVFVYTSGSFVDQEEQISETVLTTTADQQKEVTLGDGTVVHLNQQSTVTVSGSFMNQNRVVQLEGEAYFEVAHNKELPFIIRTSYSEVEVLGTSFNIRSDAAGSGRIEVAVLEGRVSFSDTREGEVEKVILQTGEYGYLDVASRQITTEDFGVENYLAWKNGEFMFYELSLDRVCVQLTRFYGVTCEFEQETLKNRRLTANFPNDDLENTLSVIAYSLHLDYKTDGDRVVWQSNREG